MAKTITWKILCLLTLFLFDIYAFAQSEAEKQYIDSLMVKATNNAMTKAGLVYADELITLANKYHISKAVNRGYECKACIYVNEDMNMELDIFCDSIEHHTNIKEEFPYVYYYISYTHGKAYMRQAKYNLAINLAKQMYDDGKEMMKKANDDHNELEKGIETFVQGIDILAEAYSEIDLHDMSLAYYEESIEAFKNLRTDEVSTNWMTSSYGRMCTALDCYGLTDGQKLLGYVDMFSEDLKLWADKNPNKNYIDALLPYYKSIIDYVYMAAYIQIGDKANVDKYYKDFMDVTDHNAMSSNFDINYYSANMSYYKYKGDYNTALAYVDSLVNYQRENEMTNDLIKSLINKLRINHLLGDYKKDFDIAEEIINLTDSMEVKRSNTQIEEMGTLLGLEKAQKEAEYEKSQRIIMMLYLAIGAVLLILLIVVVTMVIRNNVRQRKANEILDEKNCELEQQKEEILVQNENLEIQQEKIAKQNHDLEAQNKIITQSNKEINDSINYASLIQRAAMPSDKTLKSIFGEHLLIYRPLKTVSGDFYWATQRGNIKLLAVGDCTGHGVPGAFLSILGVSIFNELASKIDLENTNAGLLLDQMRDLFKWSLNQKDNDDEESNHDGIDIALVLINNETHKVQYAGAFRPLIIMRDGELIKVDADRMPIGVHYMAADHFTNHEIDIQPNDKLYMFSDGITDQFGYNEKGEVHKFTAKRMYNIIRDSSRDPFSTQKTKLEMALDNWRLEGLRTSGDKYEQTDDIVMVGISV